MASEWRPLRIVYLVRIFPSMSERFVLRQIVGMLERGHQVEIVAQRPEESPVLHAEIEQYGLLNRTRYLPTVPAGKWKCRLKTAGLILLNLARHPLDLFRVLKANLGRQRGFDYVCFYYGLCCLGRRYDIAHGHFGPMGEAALFLRKAGICRRAVTTFHGFDVTAYVQKFGPQVYRQLLEEGDLFTYNSESTRQHLLALGAPDERMVKLPMGVEVEKIPFEEKRFSAEEPVRILSVGRLVEMKGRAYAIEAVAEVMKRYPNLEYWIVGDGPLRSALQEQIDRSGFGEKIRILGWVSDEELDRLYRMCHIFLHPSVTDSDGNQEGQGVVLVEAQAYALAVIATRHGAFPETVLDGQTGFLVPERDSRALAEKIQFLLEHPEVCREMGQKGRRHAEAGYDIRSLNHQLEEIFLNL
ncbi:MAG: glycosyltransferase [Anaerohalosphaeraceae bacterium]